MSALRFDQFTDRSNVVYLFHRESVLVANMRHDPFEQARQLAEAAEAPMALDVPTLPAHLDLLDGIPPLALVLAGIGALIAIMFGVWVVA